MLDGDCLLERERVRDRVWKRTKVGGRGREGKDKKKRERKEEEDVGGEREGE